MTTPIVPPQPDQYLADPNYRTPSGRYYIIHGYPDGIGYYRRNKTYATLQEAQQAAEQLTKEARS